MRTKAVPMNRGATLADAYNPAGEYNGMGAARTFVIRGCLCARDLEVLA